MTEATVSKQSCEHMCPGTSKEHLKITPPPLLPGRKAWSSAPGRPLPSVLVTTSHHLQGLGALFPRVLGDG